LGAAWRGSALVNIQLGESNLSACFSTDNKGGLCRHSLEMHAFVEHPDASGVVDDKRKVVVRMTPQAATRKYTLGCRRFPQR
jgi:hypothetical protein